MVALLGIMVWIISGFLFYRGLTADTLATSGIHEIYAAIQLGSAGICFGLGAILLGMQLILTQLSDIYANQKNQH